MSELGVLETPGITIVDSFPGSGNASLASREVGVGEFLEWTAVEGAAALERDDMEFALVDGKRCIVVWAEWWLPSLGMVFWRHERL